MNEAEKLLTDADALLGDERRKRDRRQTAPIPKHQCPICGQGDSKVIEGRMDYEAGYYWRRRCCTNPDCQETYTTKEIVEPIDRPSARSQHLVA